MPPRAFRLEDLFGNNGSILGDPTDPVDPNTDPNTPPPDLPPTELPDLSNPPYPNPTPPLDMPFPLEQGPNPSAPTAPTAPTAPDVTSGAPESVPLIPAASPTSATAPGSFANPGSPSARPLQPFNYRSLFDPRNRTQGSLVPGSRVPTTPANIAPDAGSLGGQSESAITRALRRLRG